MPNKCRFGHTKRGSFVTTVPCPLDSVPERGNPSQGTLAPSSARRVTSRTMCAARTIDEVVDRDDVSIVNGPDESHLLSANLCDARIELAPVDDHGRLDLLSRWAKKKPFDNEAEGATAVSLRRDMVPRVEAISGHLSAPDSRDSRQALAGRIDTRNGRGNDRGEMQGPAFSRMIDADSDHVQVRIDLEPEDCQRAAEPHTNNLPVVVTGVLGRGSSGARLVGHGGLRIVGGGASYGTAFAGPPYTTRLPPPAIGPSDVTVTLDRCDPSSAL